VSDSSDHSSGLSEDDLTLVGALQVAPRAPWAAVAEAIGTSAITAQRRWARLAERGAAWVTGTPGVSVWNAHCVAYVGIRCSPGQNLAVATALAGDAHALSIDHTAGAFDLFVTVAAADLGALYRYLIHRIDTLPGVTDTHTRICTHLYRDGAHWRLGTLPREAGARLAAAAAPVAGPATWRQEDSRILVQLGIDGRTSYAALAAAAGTSETTVRRRLSSLVGTGTIQVRAEVSAHLAGWGVQVMLSVDAPSARLAEAAAAIARLRQVRLCATLAGTPALIVVAWLHHIESIHDFESTLVGVVPDITVTERLVALRTVKRMGRLLDEQGCAVGAVPMDVWADPVQGATPAGRESGPAPGSGTTGSAPAADRRSPGRAVPPRR
jgi:DNA-binding Lrp family transcriptional regulator